MAFFAELIITVVKMVFLMAVAVLGVKAGHALRVRKEKNKKNPLSNEKEKEHCL